MNIEVESPINYVWKPNPGRQEDFLSLPDDFFEAFYGGAVGGGKDLSLKECILTKDGMKSLANIHIGDIVFSGNGMPSQVIAESEVFTDHKCYELTFDNGEKIVAGKDHLWYVLDLIDREKNMRRDPEFQAKRRATRKSRSNGTRPHVALRNSNFDYKYLPKIGPKIATTEFIANNTRFRNTSNFSIEVAKPILGLSEYPIDPYTLGAWLGDGSQDSSRITSHPNDIFILDKIRSNGYEVSDHKHPYSHGILEFARDLKRSNLIQNKHIPDCYLTAPFEIRLELLKGLMDTDGYVALDGQCEISLSDPILAEDTFTLICSLGIKAARTFNKSTLYGVEKKIRCRIKFVSPFPVFSLPRKLERQKTENLRPLAHYIVSVKEVPTVPTKCIQTITGDYLVGRSLIRTHNSEVLLMLPIVRRFYENPRFHGMIFRRSYPQLEEYLIPKSKEFFTKLGGKYNDTKHRWTFDSGATISFGFLDSDQDCHDHDGTSWNYLAFDELTHFTEYMYTYLLARVRSRSKDLPAIVRSASNPGGIGHGFVRDRFITPKREGYAPLYDSLSNTYRIFIPSKIKDNPKLLEANPNYINQLQLLPESERKAKMDGDWWAFSGQVFNEFRYLRLPNEPESALHVIPTFPIPAYWPKVLSLDWGFTHKTAAYWSAISPDNRIFTYREYTCSKTPIDIWGADIGRLARQDENLVLVTMDPSAWKTESHGKTIAEQFEFASDLRVDKAINDRLNGKLAMHGVLRWAPKPPKYIPQEGFNPDTWTRIYRIYGSQAAQEYKEMFIAEQPEQNIPRWQIFDTCKELIRTIPLLVYDEKRTEDVAKFDGDDSYDAARYNIMSIDTYLKECQEEHEKYQRIAAAHNQLAKTGDQTNFYRQMESVESENKVVRYNRFRAKRSSGRSKGQIHRAS